MKIIWKKKKKTRMETEGKHETFIESHEKKKRKPRKSEVKKKGIWRKKLRKMNEKWEINEWKMNEN